MTGIFIPMEFLENENLNQTECLVLAIYRYYTLEGKQHCCSLRNEDICKMVKFKDERPLQRIKKHLKELGYIRTNGGIRVFYVGTKGDQTVTPGVTKQSPKGDQQVTRGDQTVTPGVTKQSPKGDSTVAHKKEEKRKKENKKEKEEGMEILDKLLKENYEDFFDKLIDEHKDYQNNTIDLF